MMIPFAPANRNSSVRAQLGDLLRFAEATNGVTFSQRRSDRIAQRYLITCHVSDRELRKLLKTAKTHSSLIEVNKKLGGAAHLDSGNGKTVEVSAMAGPSDLPYDAEKHAILERLLGEIPVTPYPL